MTSDIAIDYNLIKTWLGRGEIQQLAEEFQISRNAAYKILKGQFKNFAFVEACYTRAIENATKMKTLNEKLASL